MRYHILDNIRGINLVSMIVYHLIWDIVYLFDRQLGWYESRGGYIWQQSICWTFILLSGFCWSMGKNRFKRGLEISLAGLGISVVTIVFMPENRIVFGILTLMGSCTLLLIPLEHLLKRINTFLGMLLSMTLFILLKPINDGYIGIGIHRLIELPQSLFRGNFMTYIGFMKPDFYSTDYFPLIPWFFLFLVGYFLYQLVNEKDYLQVLQGKEYKPLAFIGRHSLMIYLIHQPLIYLLLKCIEG